MKYIILTLNNDKIVINAEIRDSDVVSEKEVLYQEISNENALEIDDINKLLEVQDEYGNYNLIYRDNCLFYMTSAEKMSKQEKVEYEQEQELQTMMLQAQRASFLADLPDEEASKIPYCFDAYDADPDGFPYEKDMRREYKGQLYKCLQNYKKEKDNPTQNPDVAVSLWVLTSSEEWPEWVQPTGSHDAYDTGGKVTHNGHKYTSNIDGNTTEPGTDDRWWTLVE